jgi:hypothetical protein
MRIVETGPIEDVNALEALIVKLGEEGPAPDIVMNDQEAYDQYWILELADGRRQFYLGTAESLEEWKRQNVQ